MLDPFEGFLNVSISSALRKKNKFFDGLSSYPLEITYNHKMHLNHLFLYVFHLWQNRYIGCHKNRLKNHGIKPWCANLATFFYLKY